MLKRLLLPASLIALAVLWGVAFVAIKQGLREVSPTTLAVLRFGIADLFLLGMLAAWPAARPQLRRGDLWRVTVLGLTGVPLYHLALNWGEQRTSASVAALIVATAPVMVAIGSATVLRERVTRRGVLGIALAFGGVALLAFGGENGGARTQVSGFVVALLAPVAWAVYTIVAKPMIARISSMQVTIAGVLTGSVMLLPFVTPSLVRETTRLSLEGWGWVFWLGAGGSAAGYLLFNYALTHMSATKVSVSIYMVPLVALLAAWLILSEPLGPAVGVAAAMVITGVVLTQRGGVRAPAVAEPPPLEEPVAV